MTNYTKGRSFEYRVKKHLETYGWTVFRMAGSKTKADLIGFPPRTPTRLAFALTGRGHTKLLCHSVVFIQCKAKGAFGTKEREEFLELVNRCDVVGLFACSPKRSIELYYAGDRKSADKPFLLPIQSKHTKDCAYHADQYEHECTCGLTRRAA